MVSVTGDFHYRDRRYKLRAGDLFLPDPGVYHEITSLRTHDLELEFTQFAVTESEDDPRGNPLEQQVIGDFLNGHKVRQPGQSHLTGYFDCLFRLVKIEGDPYRDFFVNELMRQLILQIMAVLTTEKQPTALDDTVLQSNLDRAIAFIEERLHEPISIRDVARAGGLSERSLRRVFRHRLNRTVVQEIQYRNMQRAAALLALPELKAAEVGRRVGIDDPARFSRIFKQTMGASPRKFRRAHAHHSPGWFRNSQLMMETEFLEGKQAKT